MLSVQRGMINLLGMGTFGMYGDMVGLLAVVLLFVVGWQVYFVVGVNRRIERLEDRLDRLELSRLEACHYSQLGMADACMAKNDYVGAVRYYLSALSHALKMDAPLNVVRVVEAVVCAIGAIPKSEKLVSCLYDEVEKIDKEIRRSKFFSVIQDEYEKAYSQFKEKVSRE